MAQIFVNSGLVKPKSIHIYNSSAQMWGNDKTGHVRVGGQWIPFIEYTFFIYKEGIEFLDFGSGNVGAGGSVTKEIDHVLIRQPGSGETTATTRVAVDVTNYETLYIDWSQTTGSADNDESYLMVGSSPYHAYNNASAARLVIKSAFSRRVSSLDVSAISGDFYIRVHARASSSIMVKNIKVFGLWLE